MDKPSKSMNKILKFLPKAAQAAVSFQNPTFSPGRPESRLKTLMPKGFSGPMIPAEARSGKSKDFETTPEPTSPKVSCMGQVKNRKINNICVKNKKQQASSLPRGYKDDKAPEIKITKPKPELNSARQLKKKPSGRLRKIFSARRGSDASAEDRLEPASRVADRAPTLSQMRRFASSRDTFSNFEWTGTAAQVAPDDDGYDEDRGYSDGEDDEVNIPFSAPILRAGLALEPRKEINLWKRRTMAQPKPLRLDLINGAQ